ncbi:MAG: xanthine dehydrogenase family protein [Candidatus Cloacimonetes bacterium]|nr:xanthine dehydrogenase family protein [Candidatus Cloacimonadota bacterium]
MNDPTDSCRIGSSFPRPEAPDKLRGQARYTDDLPGNGVLHGATVRSTCARGTIRGIQFSPTIDWSQFVIVDARDVPGKNRLQLLTDDQPVLADTRINHPAEPVLLLAHPDRETLRHAVRQVRVLVDEEPPVEDLRAAMTGSERIHGHDNLLKSYTILKGDPDSVWEGAALVVEGEYETGAQEQLYIEPQAIQAEPMIGGGVVIKGSLQCPYYVHKGLLPILDLPADRVRVIQFTTGGAFGGKEEYPSLLAAHAALLALKAGQSVRMVYERDEDMLATTKRHPSLTRIRTAIDEAGKLLALEIDFNLDGGAYVTLSPVVLSRGAIHAAGPYACPHVRVTARAWATNRPPMGAFRGFGAPQSIFALERQLDRVAAAAGLDPVEFRRMNLLTRGASMATGQQMTQDPGWSALLDHALEKSNYHDVHRRALAHNRESLDTRRGVGLSTFMHGAGFTGSGEVTLASVVEVAALAEGLIEVRTSCVEMGQGAIAVFTQIAAESAGLPASCIRIARPDTAHVPDSGPTVASRTAMVVGELVRRAVCDLCELLKAYGWTPGQSPDLFAEACRQATLSGPLRTRSQYQAPPGIHWDDATYRGDAYAAWAWAVYVAETETDLATLESRVTRFTAVQEVGRVINPVLAQGQIEGGVTQAIGWALMEEVAWRDGAMANNRLSGYIVPTAADTPEIGVHFLEHPFSHGPGGAKGIGELPMDGPAPAICAALDMALGTRITAIPALPERLLHELSLREASDE